LTESYFYKYNIYCSKCQRLKKDNIDKVEKIVYNKYDINNKDNLIMNNHQVKQDSPIKVTSSYLVDNPTQKDVQKLQKEVQQILLSNIHQNTTIQ